VTGTDPAGASVTGTTTLTVAAATPMDTATLPPATMEVDDVEHVTLKEGERLTSSVMAVVSVEPGVAPKATEWTIRAEKKGKSTVRHYGTDGNVIGSVAVTVPNQVPVRTDTPNPPTNEYLTLTRIMSGDDDGQSTTYISLAPFFTDPDGDALKYNFISQSPNILFVKAKKPASRACCDVYVDVLNEDYPSASVVVRATDSAGANAVGIMEFQIGIGSMDVVPRHYTTHQQNNGDLATIVRVELRTDATHDLKFIEVDEGGTTTEGFKFAQIFAGVMSELLDNTTVVHTAATAIAIADLPDPGTPGLGHYTVEVGNGPVTKVSLRNVNGSMALEEVPAVDMRPTEATDAPMLDFQVTGTGSDVVTVNYHVWDDNPDGDATTTDGDWQTVSETVNITVVAVPPYEGVDDLYPK
jgi:hypothetical protein